MKPKEFDDLVRQKFEQNDFAYNPAHWDRMAEQLDGKAKKRNIMMWWWAPLAGMAASVALALGVSTMLRMAAPAHTSAGLASVKGTSQQRTAQPGTSSYNAEIAQIEASAQNNDIAAIAAPDNKLTSATKNNRTKQKNTNNRKRTFLNSRVAINSNDNGDDENGDNGFRIKMQRTAGSGILLNAKPAALKKNEEDVKSKKLAIVEPIGTFMVEEEEAQVKKTRRISVILTGGYNRGAQNTGYMAGATIRKMLNDKVYIEGQVAFASSNNTQSTAYTEKEVIATNNGFNTSKQASTARTTKDLNKNVPLPAARDVIKQKDISYDLYYAQVSPSIGYNVMKKMSIGIGPDFQQALSDNRPAPSSAERGTIQVAPLFDVGFIGKTEVAVTKKLKAGVYYRKGVNNVITPMGKYIDRDYLQFQVKYTILNK